ncbi:hypothetical protein PR048_023699 [Dryococelus australis]|uniref:Uncharacterized protein n=1 Tax=Dryococelus australis TaxID=614101 RepID=A0ABQ9GUX1_9NEOP|nr:hypothetical protein PR048_023699 [Dryococelus australis]
MFSLGNIGMGGANDPAAFMNVMTVRKFPLSTDVDLDYGDSRFVNVVQSDRRMRSGEMWVARGLETRSGRSEVSNGAVPECKGGENRRSLRKPTGQWHGPSRSPSRYRRVRVEALAEATAAWRGFGACLCSRGDSFKWSAPVRGGLRNNAPRSPWDLPFQTGRATSHHLLVSRAKANRVKSPAGSLPDFRMWESSWMMPLIGGFSRGSPVPPPPLHSNAAPFSPRFTLIGSQYLVKRRSNLSTQLNNPTWGKFRQAAKTRSVKADVATLPAGHHRGLVVLGVEDFSLGCVAPVGHRRIRSDSYRDCWVATPFVAQPVSYWVRHCWRGICYSLTNFCSAVSRLRVVSECVEAKRRVNILPMMRREAPLLLMASWCGELYGMASGHLW